MILESNDAIATATPGDWLKNLAPVFQPMRSKTKRTLFSRTLSKLQVIMRNSDWLIVLFARAVIGRSNYFGVGNSLVRLLRFSGGKNSRTILNISTKKVATEKTQYPRNDKILKKGENGHCKSESVTKWSKMADFEADL